MYIFVQSNIKGNHGYIVIQKSKGKDEAKKVFLEIKSYTVN
jgi:hypothetical protein